MEKELIATGKTTDEAIQNGLKQLNLSRDDVEVEVLETSNKGIFGIIGQKDAKVSLRVKGSIASSEIFEKKDVKEDKGDTTDAGTEDYSDTEKYIKDILSLMGISGEVEISTKDNIMNIILSGESMGVVIGRRGETLDALQHIVQLYVNKNTEKFYKVRMDTESYRAKREEALSNLANGIAKRVMRTKKEVILEPMKAYERRIIHTTLQDYQNIKTYSIGNEPNRKIIVAYKYGNSSDNADSEVVDVSE